jgi:hypothetical protein
MNSIPGGCISTFVLERPEVLDDDIRYDMGWPFDKLFIWPFVTRELRADRSDRKIA